MDNYSDPRWKYIWTSTHQFYYDLLVDTQDGNIQWYSNVTLPGIPNKYICMYIDKMIEIDWYGQTSDRVLDRILADLKKELNKNTKVEKLSKTEYNKKREELKTKQEGLLLN